MAEWELNHFFDLHHLLSAATDIVVSNTIISFFIISLNRISFSKHHCFISNSAEIARCNFNHFEFNRFESLPRDKTVSFHNRAERISKVRHNM